MHASPQHPPRPSLWCGAQLPDARPISSATTIGARRHRSVVGAAGGTIEEKVVALQERKRDLFQRVVDEGGSLSGAITADDVRDLLGLA